MRKTWREKRDGANPPVVKPLEMAYVGFKPGAKMLVSSPPEIDAYCRALPNGTARTVAEMRQDLAKKHGADFTCPLTTSMFVRIVAEAALDEKDEGAALEAITPFWRVVEPEARVATKIRTGPDFIRDRRAAEAG